MKDITHFCRKWLRINPGRLLFGKVHRKFPKLRYITSGGARLEPRIFNDMYDVGFTIVEAYGLTETSPIACFNDPKNPVAGSVGHAITGVETKIEKTDSGFDQGEVCIKGPNVMMGYYKRDDATAKAIKDGWFHSGDLGYKDKKGNVFLTGRAKEIIILANGKNIYPEELEKLYNCKERIAEVCILPLGEQGKEKLTVAVHPNMEYFRRMKKSSIFQEVKYDIETASVNLPSYQRVTRVEIIDAEFPRTRLGKLKRFKIKEMIENRETGREEKPAEETTTDDPFIQFIMDELKLKFVPKPDHNLETDLGIDSLTKLELFAAVEKGYGVKIQPEQAVEIITVAHLREVVGDNVVDTQKKGFNIVEEMKKDPEIPVKKHVAVGFGSVGAMVRFSVHFILYIFIKILMRGTIKGLKNIPKKGPFIIAGNHVSYFDAFMMYGMLPYNVTHRMYSMSVPEVFERFPANLVRKAGRIIMTGTHDTMISSMQYSYIALNKKAPMCIFPEGKRSINGRVDTPKQGVFHLAKECGAPLVPVYLKGFTQLLSRPNPGFHLTKLEAEVLEPIHVEDIDKAMETWFNVMKIKNDDEYSLDR